MAINFGVAGTANAGTTSLSVGLPATVNAGDLLLLWVVNKYPSNGPAEPAGWTTVGLATGGAGSAGVDSGSVYSTLFTKVADGTEGGTSVTVSIPSGNASRGMAWTITKAADKAWEASYATGTSNTPGNWSTTFNVNPGITAGDLVWVFNGVNGDAASSWSSESLSIAGLTLGTMTERHDATTTQGDDLGMYATSHPVSSGTATAAGTYTATRAGSTTANSPTGASLLVRFREVTPPAVNVDPSAIASAQAFGTATVEQGVTATGIASAAAVGTAILDHAIDGSGIASAEAFGTATLDHAIDASGIGTAETFGTATLDRAIDGSGVASGEVFGTAVFERMVDVTSVTSAEAFGTPTMEFLVDPVGIGSEEAFGDPSLAAELGPDTIASGEAVGTPTVELDVDVAGVASAEAFGTPVVFLRLEGEVFPDTVESEESFGTSILDQSLDTAGIGSGESFGDATFDIAFDASGIESAESFGTATTEVVLDATGIDSEGVLGDPRVVIPPPHYEDYAASVDLDDYLATVEITMPFIIKAGDLSPSISGRITVPVGVPPLGAASLEMTYKGRTTPARSVPIVLDGQDPGDELVWLWHHDWEAGETDAADEYELEIGGDVGGLPMTFPSAGVATFSIEAPVA